MWLTQVIVRHVCRGNAEGRYISESILKSLFYLATQSVNMASYFGRKNLKEKPGYWCMRCGRGKKYWDQNRTYVRLNSERALSVRDGGPDNASARTHRHHVKSIRRHVRHVRGSPQPHCQQEDHYIKLGRQMPISILRCQRNCRVAAKSGFFASFRATSEEMEDRTMRNQTICLDLLLFSRY